MKRKYAFIGGPNDSTFMRWFIRCTWIVLALAMALTVGLRAEDRPIARLKDAIFETSCTPVYDFVDPVTQRRFLVVKGIAMIEATPVPVVAAPAPPAPPRVPVPPNTRDPWETSRTYAFTHGMAAAGWMVTHKTTDALEKEVFHLRRPNPDFKLPDVEAQPKE